MGCANSQTAPTIFFSCFQNQKQIPQNTFACAFHDLCLMVQPYLPGFVNVVYECPQAQTAVSLAYGVGPLLGGYLSETVGFTTILRTVGCINFCYIPVLFFLKKTTSNDRSGYEQHSNVEQQVKFRLSKKHTKICAIFIMLCSLYIYLENVLTTRKIFFRFCVLFRKSEH